MYVGSKSNWLPVVSSMNDGGVGMRRSSGVGWSNSSTIMVRTWESKGKRLTSSLARRVNWMRPTQREKPLLHTLTCKRACRLRVFGDRVVGDGATSLPLLG